MTERAVPIRPNVVTAGALGAFAAAVLLTGCAAAAQQHSSVPAAAASPSQAYVVYPGPGTAAVENNPTCQFARNPAMPAAKRRIAAAECASLLRQATAPVTKPAMPNSASPSHPVALPTSRNCTSAQLSARFAGGGLATGSDFGVIEIWNPTAEPCQLHGSATFAAYYADGSLDGKATNNRPITVAPVALPNNMPAPQDGEDLSGYLFATLMGPERDDASQPNALCRQQDKRAPATLELIIGSVRLSVPNQDAGSVQVTAVYGCHGTVLLETVEPPTGNAGGQ